jgi:hypothetical protein
LAASYNLDAGGNNSVRINDNLNRTDADVRVLIPDSVFGGNPDAYVYLYSKFSALIGTTALPGAEAWAVREIPPPSPPALLGSLSGRVYRDLNGNGQFDDGEGVGGLIVTLSGIDAFGNNLYPNGDPTVATNSDGTYSFDNLAEGTYFILVAEQQSGDTFAAILGTTTDSNSYDGDPTTNGFAGIALTPGELGTEFNLQYFPAE